MGRSYGRAVNHTVHGPEAFRIPPSQAAFTPLPDPVTAGSARLATITQQEKEVA